MYVMKMGYIKVTRKEILEDPEAELTTEQRHLSGLHLICRFSYCEYTQIHPIILTFRELILILLLFFS